jgi:hypothetical protein
MIVAHTTRKLFSFMSTSLSTGMQWTRQPTPAQGPLSVLPATMPHDRFRSLSMQSISWHCRHTVRTLSFAANNLSALQGDQAHSPTDYSACCRSTGASSYTCAGHTRPHSLTHLALRAVLGAQGTAPEVTPEHHLAAPDDTALG